MDDTSLHVYPGYFGAEAEADARRTFRFHRGEVVMFCGNLAHAGAWFRHRNVRLHCFIKRASLVLTGVRVQPVGSSVHTVKNAMLFGTL
ncbi:hypothetical protein PPTG_20810 [Phytophthora nicotianae INRA-310]|uniref:Uncharacterized protein n=1 Tax=Phytophthora nicotianae (strain INRA-310) TaxID=761204 RepID=W2RHI4_PHYN3|nr:hypothetical protein PPTG_20810 [Phytophthora nicotianae INRA-310]ETN24686.1 hypothetical protein PPTG_20810 [Phytophthora nicotianae INRA-310]